ASLPRARPKSLQQRAHDLRLRSGLCQNCGKVTNSSQHKTMSSSIDASTIGLNFLPNEWKEKLLTKPLFVAIDRDGTLVPYQTDPGEAIVEPDVRAVVNDLADVPNVIAAVVSARGTTQLKKDFGNEKVILASSYGLELSFPGGEVLVQPEVEAARTPLQQVK